MESWITNSCGIERNREILTSYRSLELYNNQQLASYANSFFKHNIEPHINKNVVNNAYHKLKKLIHR